MSKGCGKPKMARGGSVGRTAGSRIGTQVAGITPPSLRQRSRNLRAASPPSSGMTMPSTDNALRFAKGGCAGKKKDKC